MAVIILSDYFNYHIPYFRKDILNCFRIAENSMPNKLTFLSSFSKSSQKISIYLGTFLGCICLSLRYVRRTEAF
jgi:hypothetical protein